MLTRAQLQQFFTGLGMIFIFICVKKSPLEMITSYWIWGIVGVIFIMFGPAMAKKLKGEG